MSEKDLIPSSQRPGPVSEPASNVVPITRARFFKITPTSPIIGPGELEQVIRTAEALARAGMSLEPIPNYYRGVGFTVEEGEVDAPVRNLNPGQNWGVERDEEGVTAWRETGEKFTLYRLPSPKPITDREPIPIQSALPERIDVKVFQGIRVNNKPAATSSDLLDNNPTSQHDADLVRSPYLQGIPEKKAA